MSRQPQCLRVQMCQYIKNVVTWRGLRRERESKVKMKTKKGHFVCFRWSLKDLKPNSILRTNLDIWPKSPTGLWWVSVSVCSASRQEVPHGGEQAGWGLRGRAERDDHIIRGIHAPLTCYCELPAALADNCHLSLGKRSQRKAEGRPFCMCRSSSPRTVLVLILPLTLAANVFSI